MTGPTPEHVVNQTNLAMQSLVSAVARTLQQLHPDKPVLTLFASAMEVEWTRQRADKHPEAELIVASMLSLLEDMAAGR